MSSRKQFYCPRYKEEFNYTIICKTCPERSSCVGLALKLINKKLDKINKIERESL